MRNGSESCKSDYCLDETVFSLIAIFRNISLFAIEAWQRMTCTSFHASRRRPSNLTELTLLKPGVDVCGERTFSAYVKHQEAQISTQSPRREAVQLAQCWGHSGESSPAETMASNPHHHADGPVHSRSPLRTGSEAAGESGRKQCVTNNGWQVVDWVSFRFFT